MNRWIWMYAVMLTVSPVAYAAEPVAMITDIQGKAWLQNHGKEVKLTVLSYLEPGMSLRLDNKSSVTIATFSPATVLSVSGPARLELQGGGVRLAGGASLQGRNLDESRVSAARKFSVAQRERITIAAYQMKSLDTGLKLQSPVNTVLLTDRPVFQWVAPQNVLAHVLKLTDEDEGKQLSEVTVSLPEWTLPENLSLQREHHYSWKVTARLPLMGEISSVGKFSILSEARAEKIAQQKPADTASFSDRVLYAVLLESEGLKTDAAVAWKALAAERPDEAMLKVFSQ